MKRNLALILGILFLVDSFVFAFSNMGIPVTWTYWKIIPTIIVDAGMMIAFITFYAAVAGYLLGYYINSNK